MASYSRLVDYEQLKRNWLKHEDRLIHIKSTLKTRQPIPRIPSTRKANLCQHLNVELENKALLKKLTDRVQSKQDVSICSQSLNQLPKSNRKRYYEEYRIKCENQGMYRRLKRTKPIIDTETLKLQRAQTQKLLNTISKFKYRDLKPNKTFIRFDMQNNDLKYLSRRKILLQQKIKDQQEPSRLTSEQKQKILQKEVNKKLNNEKLFNYLSRFRKIEIDSQETILKITQGKQNLLIEISKLSDKENNEGELEVQISKQLFKEKYSQDLEQLIGKFKYDQKSRNFYIL